MSAVFTASISGDDVALSTTAVPVVTASPTASRSEPEKIVVQNNSAIAVTVGGPDVAAGSNGIVLAASGNNSVTLHLTNPGERVFAIAASGTPSVQVTRVG
jgi:hypothetical protein